MTEVDGARPQDVERPHRRKGKPSAATTALLARYHAAMRADLARTLEDLEGTASSQLELDGSSTVKRPALAERVRLWELAIKLGRELGTEIDVGRAPGEALPAPARRRRGRVDFG